MSLVYDIDTKHLLIFSGFGGPLFVCLNTQKGYLSKEMKYFSSNCRNCQFSKAFVWNTQ